MAQQQYWPSYLNRMQQGGMGGQRFGYGGQGGYGMGMGYGQQRSPYGGMGGYGMGQQMGGYGMGMGYGQQQQFNPYMMQAMMQGYGRQPSFQRPPQRRQPQRRQLQQTRSVPQQANAQTLNSSLAAPATTSGPTTIRKGQATTIQPARPPTATATSWTATPKLPSGDMTTNLPTPPAAATQTAPATQAPRAATISQPRQSQWEIDQAGQYIHDQRAGAIGALPNQVLDQQRQGNVGYDPSRQQSFRPAIPQQQAPQRPEQGSPQTMGYGGYGGMPGYGMGMGYGQQFSPYGMGMGMGMGYGMPQQSPWGQQQSPWGQQGMGYGYPQQQQTQSLSQNAGGWGNKPALQQQQPMISM